MTLCGRVDKWLSAFKRLGLPGARVERHAEEISDISREILDDMERRKANGRAH